MLLRLLVFVAIVLELFSIAQCNNNDHNNKNNIFKIDLIKSKATKKPARNKIFNNPWKASEALTSGNDIYYYGVVSVGTPAQDFKVDFDTGSSDFWLMTDQCDTCSPNARKFNESESSTFTRRNQSFAIVYGDTSSTSGYSGIDIVSLGGLDVVNQTFALVTKQKGFSHGFSADGLLGLGFSTISGNRSPTVIENARLQGLISQNVFSFWFNRHPTSELDGGELIIGGIDSTRYTGDITYAPLIFQGYWMFRVDNIKIENLNGSTNKTCSNGCLAIADTGTSLIVGPLDDVFLINTALGGSDSGSGLFMFNCSEVSSLPPITFTINGNALVLNSSDYVMRKRGNCYSGITVANSFWVLGDVFLRAYYTIYDADASRVGFAQSVSN